MKSKINSGVSARNLICWTSERTKCLKRLACLKALAFLGICFYAAPLPAQTPATATITFANGDSITVGSNDQQIFSPIDILPGETLGIQLQLPPSFVGTPVGIQPLDGGLTPDELQVAQDGSAAFAFQAGAQPGLYRILLCTAHTSALLQFWVPNPENP